MATPDPKDPWYAWAVYDHDLQWGIVAGVIPGLGPVPLISRNRETVKGPLRPYAEQHRLSTGQEVRLLVLTPTETLVVLP